MRALNGEDVDHEGAGVGIDLSEVAPAYDPTGIASPVAAMARPRL
jgi:arginase family enzyme